MRKIILSLIMTVCALLSGAQTLTRTYVEYADSADRYIRNENWVDAERMIVNALRLEPANKSNYLLWSNVGIVRDRIGNTEGALQAFDIGLASAPRSTVLLANRAYTLMKTGRDKEALRDLDLALELDSTLLVPRLSRAGLHLNARRLAEAGKDYAAAVSIHPDSAGGHEGLGDVASLQGDNRKASEEYAREIAIADSENLRFKKILALIGAEDTNTAEEEMHTAIGKFPRSGGLHLLRGVLHKRKYQNAEAEIERKLALEYGADPDLVDAMLPQSKK